MEAIVYLLCVHSSAYLVQKYTLCLLKIPKNCKVYSNCILLFIVKLSFMLLMDQSIFCRFQILRELIPHSDQKRDRASFLLEVQFEDA